MHRLAALILTDLFGPEAANPKSDAYFSLLKQATFSGDCPAICRKCKTVYESGFEPDSTEGYCEECEAQAVTSILILEGLI